MSNGGGGGGIRNMPIKIMKTKTNRQEIEKIVEKSWLKFGESHSQGRELTHKDLERIQKQQVDQLLTLQEKAVEERVREVMADIEYKREEIKRLPINKDLDAIMISFLDSLLNNHKDI